MSFIIIFYVQTEACKELQETLERKDVHLQEHRQTIEVEHLVLFSNNRIVRKN